MKYWRLFSLCALPFFLLVPIGCVSSSSPKFGVEKEYLANIPARIAVLSCRLWPQAALFRGQETVQVSADARASLCESYDHFVLRGFEGQPFMRGLSPKVVQALLDKAQQGAFLSSLDAIWGQTPSTCEACDDPLSYYREIIAPSKEWRTWLGSLGRYTTHSDAVLLPLVVSASEGRFDDRGLIYARRVAQVVLFLFDSDNGKLMWSGGRAAEVRLPIDRSVAKPADAQYPAWDELFKRIFTDDLWLEFPGRQS